MFKVGDKVICVCEKNVPIDAYVDWFANLIKNKIVHTVVNVSATSITIKAGSDELFPCSLLQIQLYKSLPKNYKGLVGRDGT